MRHVPSCVFIFLRISYGVLRFGQRQLSYLHIPLFFAMHRYVQCPSILALTLLLNLSRLLYAQQVCYYPDGTEATDHTPCNGSASNTPTDASSCCHDISNSYCQDNNLCTWNGAMYRGACTDKTWTSPNCPQQCTEGSQSSYPIFDGHD